ncbi:MAG: hypothetical protein J6C85_03305 [Alphaproteobacteria bacterium]|nr:hypothetical protein [Alphaproteobacteria bacterium]
MNKTQQPSSLSTRIEVWRFLCSNEHKIDDKHHINMVSLKGCSPKALLKYVKHYRISDEALKVLLKTGHSKLCYLWLDNRRHCFPVSDEIIELAIKSLGLTKVCSSRLHFSKAFTKELLKKGKIKLIKDYFFLLEFDKETEAMLLNLKDESLAAFYYKYCRQIFTPDLVLAYNTLSVFEAFGSAIPENNLSNELFAEILKTKTTEIQEQLLEFDLEERLQIALIDLGRADLIERFLSHRNFEDKAQIHLVRVAGDELFYAFMRNQTYFCDKVAPMICERLFAPENREFLKQYLKDCPVEDSIKNYLLQTKDDELIKLYYEENTIDPKTSIALAQNGDDTQKDLLEDSGVLLDYFSLAQLFKSNDNARIEKYLKKLQHPLYPFGQALLIKYADEKIVKDYLVKETNELSSFAMSALVRRNSEELFECFYERKEIFSEKPFREFIATASPKSILRYLELFFDEIQETIDEDEFDWTEAIFKRQDKELENFFLDKFNDSYGSLVAKYASKEFFERYLEDYALTDEEFELLIERGDKELVLAYIEISDFKESHYPQDLLWLLDEDVIKHYEELYGDECGDDDFLEALGNS